jgi:tetratricopeptide (TPR) repeat protein
VLFDQGALVRDGALRLTTPLGQLRIPPTVQGILTARIDRLPPAEKQLLQTLAVIGREFPLPLIRGVTQLADDELERMLAGLQMGEFLYEQPAIPDVEYTFKHALTQEVAYNSVLTERRTLLHGQTAAALEALHSGNLEDHLAELAHHYSRSRNAAKAVEYLRRAAEQAAARSAFQEAVTQLNAALGLLENLAAGPARDGQELALRMALVMPMMATGGFTSADAKVNLERARALCSGISDPVTTVRVLTGLRAFYLAGGDLRVVRELDAQMLEIAARNPSEMTTYLANVGIGSTATWMGELRCAREHVERALAVDENAISTIGAGGGPPIYVAIGGLSYVLWMLGYPDQALREQARMASLLSRPINLFHRAGILQSSLWTRCHFLRDYHGMRQQAEALLELARENGFTINVGMGLVRLGRILVEEQNFAAGIETMLEGMHTLDAIGVKLMYANFCCVLAEAYLAAGRPSEGLAVAEEALEYPTNGFCKSELHRLKGELLLLAGAPESEAEKSLREAIAIAQRQEARSWELRAATSLARLLGKQGRGAEALAMLAEICNWFTEGFDTADLRDAKALLEELSK